MIRIWAFALSRFGGAATERGATMVEYALILVTIATVVVGGALLVGGATDVKYDEVEACFQSHANC